MAVVATEEAATVLAGGVEEEAILEDSLDMDFLDIVGFLVVEDFPVDLLVSVEDLVMEDTVNTHRIAARGSMVLEDITEVATVDTVGAGLADTPMAAITMAADITEATLGIIIEDGLPIGVAFRFFYGGVIVGGISNPFWWPYYYAPVGPGYYDAYPYPYLDPAPSYIVQVPPPEATTAYQEGPHVIEVPPTGATTAQGPPPATTPPNQCYAPKTDPNGNMIKENGNPIPDFSKPVPCPPQQ